MTLIQYLDTYAALGFHSPPPLSPNQTPTTPTTTSTMCGRFALGLPPAEIRFGVADHFPRLLRNPEARAARARHGEEGRQRQRQDRQRRRQRGERNDAASAAGGHRDGDVREQEHQQQEEEDQEEEFEWPPSDEGNSSTTVINNNPESEIAAAAARLQWENEERFRVGNYNVAPRSNGVVLRLRPRSQSHPEAVQEEGSDLRLRGGGEEGEVVEHVDGLKVGKQADKKNVLDVGDQELVIETMQWGLIPHWSKHPPSGALNTINARSEALIDNAGGMWQSLKGPKRCLVVVEGYYEWQKKSGAKIPHFTKLPSTTSSKPHLMLLAGLYDTVRYIDSDPSSPPVKTFTILTTTPSKSLGWLHDRMPCVLESEEECVRWLDCRSGWTGEVAKLLRPYEGEVECYPVPTEVGKVGTNSPSYVIPVKERKDGIANFFKKQSAGHAVPAPLDESKKMGHLQDSGNVKLEQGKRSRKEDVQEGGQPVDDSRPGKRLKMDVDLAADEKVHTPVASKAISISSKDPREADTKPKSSNGDNKASMKQRADEEEFEMQIGDDSNAPNSTGGAKREGKGKPSSSGDAKPIVGSKRQTRSDVRRKEADEKPATRSTRSGKLSTTSTKERKKESDDEIQILSSPDTIHRKTKESGTTSGSLAAGKHARATKQETVKQGDEQAKAAVQATAEDGPENTHQTKLDGFLKHEA